jgi:hypothetical protein
LDTREQAPQADEPVILKDHREDRARNRDRRVVLAGNEGPVPLKLILPGGTANPDAQILGADGQPAEAPPALTWDQYLAWRKTKCRPYDYANGPALATSTKTADLDLPFPKRERALEEIDQATLEFIGEVAELAELFLKHGPAAFYGADRAKLIDECGDVFFCGAWVLDAWGRNPLYGADDLEFVRVTDEDPLSRVAVILGTNPLEALARTPVVGVLGGMVLNALNVAQAHAGLLANSFKKLKYQRREQDVTRQVERVATVFFQVNQILILANSSVEDALLANKGKLDARYPDGYQPGQGGGHREGAGK